MARRNHSRRVHTPYGDQGIGYAEDYGGRQASGVGRGDEGWDDEGRGDAGPWGGVQRIVSDAPTPR